MHLLARFPRGQDALFELLENGALRIAFRIDEHVPALRKLRQKYRDRPMSLADACVVRMSEIHDQYAVLTLDSDFMVYRKHAMNRLVSFSPPTNSAVNSISAVQRWTASMHVWRPPILLG